MKTSFNKPYITGKELEYISEAHASLYLYGNGQLTKKCQIWLEKRVGCQKSLLCVGMKG